MTAPGGTPDQDREATLAQTLVTIADTLVNDFDVTDLFGVLTTACVELLGATAAGLMLVDPEGQLRLMASSSDMMRELEIFEMDHQQGPCMDAYGSSRQISVDLRGSEAASRWPAFTRRALAASLVGVQALPMRLRGNTIGALNLFHTDEARFDARDTALAQALADLATIAILQRRALSSSEQLTGQLQAALNDRVVIEQAKGLLAERGQVSVDVAFRLLREYVRTNRLHLTDTAREIIDGRRDPDDVLAQRWPHSLR